MPIRAGRRPCLTNRKGGEGTCRLNRGNPTLACPRRDSVQFSLILHTATRTPSPRICNCRETQDQALSQVHYKYLRLPAPVHILLQKRQYGYPLCDSCLPLAPVRLPSYSSSRQLYTRQSLRGIGNNGYPSLPTPTPLWPPDSNEFSTRILICRYFPD